MKLPQAAVLLRSGCSLAALVSLTTQPVAAESDFWIDDAVTGCGVWSAEAPRPGEGVSWSGACDGDKASGLGVLVFWDETGLRGRYLGEMVGGKLAGEGRLFLREEKTEKFHEYIGRFADGKPEGKGYLKTAAGDRFIGELIDGVSHGKGTLLTTKGWLIRGEIKDDQGVGTLLVEYSTEDGEKYFGQMENEKRHGFGTLKNSNGDFYAGSFAEGLPSGPGIYKGAVGDRYTGDFLNGKANGFGTGVDAEGNVVQGRFVNGEPEGTLLVTMPDGTQSVTDSSVTDANDGGEQ